MEELRPSNELYMDLLTFGEREAVAIGFLDLLSHKERYPIRRGLRDPSETYATVVSRKHKAGLHGKFTP
jgi:hypothetical protein